jgi:hypothetical protein
VGPETHRGQGGPRREENSLGSGVSRGEKTLLLFQVCEWASFPFRDLYSLFSMDFDMGVRRNYQGSME